MSLQRGCSRSLSPRTTAVSTSVFEDFKACISEEASCQTISEINLKKQKMIRAVLVMNTQGRPRITKFYEFWPVEKQHEAIRNVFSVLCSRAEHVSNFVDAESIFGPDSRLVYKHFATLYFVLIFDSSENELAMLDLIQDTCHTRRDYFWRSGIGDKFNRGYEGCRGNNEARSSIQCNQSCFKVCF
nr:AP-4 complex subunit sigma-1 isoform X2 [Arachis hypogaea]